MATPTMVLLPIWGAGHLMPMLEAGKRLLSHSSGDLSLTVLVIRPPTPESTAEAADLVRREQSAAAANSDRIDFLDLPAVDYASDLFEPEPAPPHVRDAITALPAPVATLVIDSFCTVVLDVSLDLAVSAYVYCAGKASTFVLLLSLKSNEEAAGAAAVDVPGLPPVPRSTLPTPLQDMTSYKDATGILINTAEEFEPTVLAAVANRAPAIYPIGPVVSLTVSASSGCCASRRHPTDADLEELLPGGFLERTNGKGLVWPTKAPQKEILAHAAVGGFVMHCGWNSVMESLWLPMSPSIGYQMVPWPLYAEQHFSALMLKNNWVDSGELECAVKCLMGSAEKGAKVRQKAMEMKNACRIALEKGGSSYKALQSLYTQAALVLFYR
ncbi:hypothetical protein BS78_05G129600 [Paspalum vaginatum]|nr:hypothetical protein BS78_05G129600 [Paspalum vaginatum]